MLDWLFEISIYILFGLAIYTRSLYQEHKKTKEQLEEVIKINHQIYEELTLANQEIEELKYGKSQAKTRNRNSHDFLSADDPMEALLREVGRVKR